MSFAIKTHTTFKGGWSHPVLRGGWNERIRLSSYSYSIVLILIQLRWIFGVRMEGKNNHSPSELGESANLATSYNSLKGWRSRRWRRDHYNSLLLLILLFLILYLQSIDNATLLLLLCCFSAGNDANHFFGIFSYPSVSSCLFQVEGKGGSASRLDC